MKKHKNEIPRQSQSADDDDHGINVFHQRSEGSRCCPPKPVKNVAQATHYFLGQDNYYTENNTLAQEHSQWWGQGAKVDGIIGYGRSRTIYCVIAGSFAQWRAIGEKSGWRNSHRPGFDLTFSAPKSVSILALLGDDERIFKAIERATDKTLA